MPLGDSINKGKLMNCPNCGCTIDQPTSLVQTEDGDASRRCILCDRPQEECGEMVVGVGGGVCVACVLLSMEMINNPAKYGATADREPQA